MIFKPALLAVLKRPRALLLLLCASLGVFGAAPAGAVIVFRASASGINTGLPTNGTAGALTILRPAGAKPGMVMIVSIAARPSGMTWTTPAGGAWTLLSITSEQPNGGVSTAPGGMTLRTYYRIVGLAEPNSYTWTFSNPSLSGGTAVAGMLVFSGIDTATNPINGTPTSVLSASGTTFSTTPVTTTVANTMMISVLSVLSADSFGVPSFIASTPCTNSGASAITDALDVRSPVAASATGTTIDMAYFTQANAGVSCATKATIATSGSADYGVAHLMALRPSLRDLSLVKTRTVPLSPGGAASYTLTASNDGSLSEPGPLAIVDTLPAGLTYSGFAGAGWSCSVSGQDVTCTKSGALPAGQAATPLVINVNVAAGLNGVITNSAIVSGTGGDGNNSNDTATDTYVILPQPYAYYAMDEASNATSFANTTAITAAPATALGTAKALGNPPPTVGAAIPNTPGTCGAASNPVTAGAGVNTGIDVNTIGNAGSIAFWYAGAAGWNDSNPRMLFDASVDGGATDRHFFLVKDATGRLIFSLKDSANLVSTATSPSYAFAANSWHHIAVTWDLAADKLAIYLDGDTVPVATSVINVNGVLGDMATLYMGAQRSTGVTGTPVGYTANTANGYLDEVRIYNRALLPLEVEAVADLTHACAGTVDHYELIVPSTASACVPLPAVQVYACAAPATASSCAGNLQAAVNGKTVGLIASNGTLGNTSPAFDAIGQTNTTLNYPAGGSATITLAIGATANPAPGAQAAMRCCPNGSSCSDANSCTTVITACSFPPANFDVVDSDYAANSYDSGVAHRIFTKLAGWDETTGAVSAGAASTFKLDVVALKTGNTTETGYVGAGTTKNVKMELLDDSGGSACNASGAACAACAKPVVATINPVSFAPGDAGYKNDMLVTIANTNAYQRLIARITDTNGTPTVIGCSSDAFAVRPSTVLLTSSANASPAPLNTATPVVKAGAPFTLYATTAYGANYGGTLTLDPAQLSAQLPTQTTRQIGGVIGTLAHTALVANPSPLPALNATYSEVGYLYLGANAYLDKSWNTVDQNSGYNDCIDSSTTTVKTNGRYGCWIGTEATFSLGRFIPDHFVTTLVPADGTFTYSGQPFTSETVTAVNASGATTANYYSNFASSVTLSDGNGAINNSATLGVLKYDTGTAVPSTKFVGGVATLTSSTAGETLVYTFNNRETAPLSTAVLAPFQLRAVSTADGVSSAGFEAAAISPILSGRVRMSNAYGSAQLPMTIPVTAQYYTAQGWITNLLDTGASGSHLLAAPSWSSTPALLPTSATCPTLACSTTSSFTAGILDLRLSAPGIAGYADLVLNVPSWLEYTWLSTTAGDPRARATFGIYKGQNRIIYRRERY